MWEHAGRVVQDGLHGLPLLCCKQVGGYEGKTCGAEAHGDFTLLFSGLVWDLEREVSSLFVGKPEQVPLTEAVV